LCDEYKKYFSLLLYRKIPQVDVRDLKQEEKISMRGQGTELIEGVRIKFFNRFYGFNRI
jgi:hypothetical protein